MAKSEVIKIVKRFVRALKQQGISIQHVILYGSYAADKAHPDSDIDVAIVSKNFGRDRVEEGMSLLKIAGKIDSRLEPVPISSEAYENDTWIPLIYEVREKGVELKVG